jgi:hypothetical protein
VSGVSSYTFESILTLVPLVVMLVAAVIVLATQAGKLPGKVKALAFAGLGVEVVYLLARIGYAFALPQLIKSGTDSTVVFDAIDIVEEVICWAGFILLIVAVVAGRTAPPATGAPAAPYNQWTVPPPPTGPAPYPQPPYQR